jgi:hypothetical protein
MAVNISVIFWLVGQGLSLFGAASEADWHDGVMYPVFTFMVALFLLVAWQVRQGRNWARWTLVVFVAFRLLGVHRLVSHFSDIPAYKIFSDVLLLTLLAGAVWLLFSDSSKEWFRNQSVRRANKSLQPTATTPSALTEK